MYFHDFKIRFEKKTDAESYECNETTAYQVLAMELREGAINLLIRNNSSKLKWIPESMIKVTSVK